MTTKTTTKKKDFWAPFRTDFKTFVSLTRKASAAGATAAVATTGALIGDQLTHGKFDGPAIGADALAFIGAFVAGFAAAYSANPAE